MWNSLSAELFILSKRTGVWVLLGLWTAMATLFGYIFPYITYLNGSRDVPGGLPAMLPGQLVSKVIAGFPFYGGAMALVLAVLAFGSEYSWGTLKTVFTQGPGRLHLVVAKATAIGIALIAFVVAAFAAGALGSVVIALREGQAIVWPSAWLILRGAGLAWLLLAVWAGLGSVLAVASRGTGLAIGIGILYGLVIEGLVSALATQTKLFEPVADLMLRANGYSLLRGLGVAGQGAAENGPGAFRGPFVSEPQAFIVLATYLVGFVLITAIVVRRRDVS